jgi:hypothetical protein
MEPDIDAFNLDSVTKYVHIICSSAKVPISSARATETVKDKQYPQRVPNIETYEGTAWAKLNETRGKSGKS